MKLFAKLKESKVFKRVALMCSAVVVAAMGAIGASAEVSAPSPADIVAGVPQVTPAVTSQLDVYKRQLRDVDFHGSARGGENPFCRSICYQSGE